MLGSLFKRSFVILVLFTLTFKCRIILSMISKSTFTFQIGLQYNTTYLYSTLLTHSVQKCTRLNGADAIVLQVSALMFYSDVFELFSNALLFPTYSDSPSFKLTCTQCMGLLFNSPSTPRHSCLCISIHHRAHVAIPTYEDRSALVNRKPFEIHVFRVISSHVDCIPFQPRKN